MLNYTDITQNTLSHFGLKVHCGKRSRTFSTRRNPFIFLSPEAISWWWADFGLWQEGRVWPRLPAEVGCDVPENSDFGFRVGRFCWDRHGQLRKKDAAWGSRRVGRCLRYVRTKFMFEWWILNSVSFGVLRHTGRLRYRCSVFLRHSVRASVGDVGTGEASDFCIVWVWNFSTWLFVIWYFLFCYCVTLLFFKSNKAHEAFIITRALNWCDVHSGKCADIAITGRVRPVPGGVRTLVRCVGLYVGKLLCMHGMCLTLFAGIVSVQLLLELCT